MDIDSEKKEAINKMLALFRTDVTPVLLVAIEEKKACSISKSIDDDDDVNVIKDIFDTLELSYDIVSCDSNRIYIRISKDEELISDIDNDIDHVQKGRFYDFPTEQIHWYTTVVRNSDMKPLKISKQKTKELVLRGYINPYQIEYMSFVNYIPKPTIESINSAIADGMQKYNHLQTFAEENNLIILQKYLVERLEKNTYL